MAVSGKSEGPEQSLAAVAVDETGKQAGQAKKDRSPGSLAVEE
jgi:hypothetical protein